MTIRVVQWTTGNVGKESVKAIVANPALELVGGYAWSDSKVGTDIGELVGIDPLGIAATNDVDALLALNPDCVVYNPMWPSVDELVHILEAGVNNLLDAVVENQLADRRQVVDLGWIDDCGQIVDRDLHEAELRTVGILTNEFRVNSKGAILLNAPADFR